jgi:2-polyprenyl-3-methyl-5-hydroxy-6-metoxy-1,4-benzoquinol methylase
LNEIEGLTKKEEPKKLLDVGCAHGWFLKLAMKRGFHAMGVEPDAKVAAKPMQEGLEVRTGFFPEVLRNGEKFDVISFNDVFEHLPDIKSALESAHEHLNKGGLLVINLPDSKGVYYSIAKTLSKAGVTGPLERLWQKNFPSPHLSYFNAEQLLQLGSKSGFEPVLNKRLPSLLVKGLWSRLRYDSNASLLSCAVVWCGSVALRPLLGILPSDISLEIFRKV